MPSETSAADIYGREFPAGAVIFEEGDPGSRMYVIQAGAVRIEKRTGARTLTLATLGPGDFFGEMALLERQPRSAAAVVAERSRILEIDEAAFEDLVRTKGEVALRLLRRLSTRLRAANRQIRNFLSADALAREVEVLRALAGPPGADGFRPVSPELGPEQLAERAGALEDAARLWDRLRRARLVREVGGSAALAPAEVVDDFLRYVELKARYDAIALGELAEVAGIDDATTEGILDELLHARLGPKGELGGDAGVVRRHLSYLALKRRFEPEG